MRHQRPKPLLPCFFDVSHHVSPEKILFVLKADIFCSAFDAQKGIEAVEVHLILAGSKDTPEIIIIACPRSSPSPRIEFFHVLKNGSELLRNNFLQGIDPDMSLQRLAILVNDFSHVGGFQDFLID